MKVDQAYPYRAQDYIHHKRVEDTSTAINGNLEFGDPVNGSVNISGFWVSMVTGAADTEFTVTHNLGKIPTGIIVTSVDKAAIVYASRKNSWTTTQAFFKVNAATVVLTGFIV